MSLVKKYNAQNDTTYVYESVSYWDKELKQPRSKRKLIGKLDPVTGEIVPTGGRGRKPKEPTVTSEKPQTKPVAETKVSGSCSENTALTEVDDEDIQVLYDNCRHRLLETEAALAKAESAIAALTAEKQELKEELERLLRSFNH